MKNDRIHLLCTGDLHLGRHPSHIPEEYDSSEYSPITIWENIVRKAVDLQVDGLIISGDIIDRKNRFYEAYGPFEAGIKKMEKEEIPVFVISGNHDYEILPGIADNLDSDYFFLLGTNGKWENQFLYKKNKPVLNIMGWSYPVRNVRQNPLKNFPEVKKEDIPAVGLVHSEIDNPGSTYAPVSTDELQEMNICGWITGHIHKPELKENFSSFVLNPGTPQPLDPGESGSHFVWEVFIESKTDYEFNKLELSSLKYEKVQIDISFMKHIEELPALITKRIRRIISEKDFSATVKLLIVRLTLSGNTEFTQEIENIKDKLCYDLELNIAGIKVIVDEIYDSTSIKVDIEKLAEGNTPVSLIAEYIYKINSGKEEELPESLMETLEKKLLEVYNANAYRPLRTENRINSPDKKKIREILTDEGRKILNILAAQKEGE